MPGSSSTMRILAIRTPISIAGKRQHDGEGAAGAHSALEVDRAAQCLGNLPHHREPDAGALDSGFLGGSAADELLKNGVLFAWVDSHAPIAHGDGHVMVLHRSIHPNRSALGRVF